MKKLVIIGIDAGTFTIIDKMIKEGCLPNMKKMMDGGVRATLRSTPYYWTIPAWTTMVTGVNAGKHGGYSLTTTEGYHVRPTSSRDIKAQCIWDHVGFYGGRSLVCCVPGTYPPKPMRGCMITGMQTPSEDSNYTYPKELKQEILKIDSEFKPELFDGGILDHYIISMHIKMSLYTELLRRKKWNLAMLVFTEIDKVQHFNWGHRGVELLYEMIDDFIGDVIYLFDVDIMVVSDHGAGKYECSMNLNNWLLENGYQRLRWIVRAKNRLKRKKETPGLIIGGDGYTHPKLSTIEKLWNAIVKPGDISSVIDMNHTLAFTVESGIRLNIHNREPGGSIHPADNKIYVDDLISKLRELEDPNGNPAFDLLCPREDIYHGPYIDRAPDIIVVRQGGIQNPMEGIFKQRSGVGHHVPEGIFIYKPKNMNLGIDIGEMDIGEIAPLTLELLGLPVPEDLDFKIGDWVEALKL